MENCIEIISIINNTVAHTYKNEKLLLSSRNKIYEVSNLKNPILKNINQIPFNRIQKIFKFRYADRLLRNDIKVAYRSTSGEYLVCNRKGWWKFYSNSKVEYLPELSNTQPMARGICENKDGNIYIADYSQNHQRKEVRIYRSNKAGRFETAYKFQEKEIRHIHALVKENSQKDRIWVLTGDQDSESHFFYTDDNFNSLQLSLSAGQISRAADLIFRDQYILWGTDSPTQKNHIVKTSIDSPKNFKLIAPLPGPVYYTCQNQLGGTYFATTAEPGPASEKNKARIYSLNNDYNVHEIHNCRRDFIPQHGIVYFPSGILPENYIIFSLKALTPNEGCTIIARDMSLKN